MKQIVVNTISIEVLNSSENVRKYICIKWHIKIINSRFSWFIQLSVVLPNNIVMFWHIRHHPVYELEGFIKLKAWSLHTYIRMYHTLQHNYCMDMSDTACLMLFKRGVFWSRLVDWQSGAVGQQTNISLLFSFSDYSNYLHWWIAYIYMYICGINVVFMYMQICPLICFAHEYICKRLI